MSRTNVDFSEHEVLITQNQFVNVWHLKRPSSIIHNIKYINTNGVLVVTGDFGNWVFCREFHPSEEGYVSGGYWDEKLEILSEQKSHAFDSDVTVELISEFEKDFEQYYGREMSEEEKEWIEELKSNVYDEIDYVQVAYRNSPSTIERESIPFGQVRHKWLDAVYDGFDEICKRYREGIIK